MWFNVFRRIFLIQVLISVAFFVTDNAYAATSSIRCAISLEGKAHSRGIIAISPETSKRVWAEIKELKIVSYNVENLNWHVGRFDRTEANRLTPVPGRGPLAKPEHELQEIRKILQNSNPDLVVLQEVEDILALEQLAKKDLAGRYQAFLIEGNDERGIDIGFLIKTDLPIFVETITHKDVTYSDPADNNADVRLFSRDLPALVLRTAPQEKPFMILLGNHAKSKRDRPGDPQSMALRTTQYQAVNQIITQFEAQYGENTPIFLAGDFNTDVRSASEIDPIRQTTRSAFDELKVSIDQRITHSYFPNGGGPVYSQLDDMRANLAGQNLFRAARVIRYQDKNGNILPLPQTYEERQKQPSDHSPIEVVISRP